MFDWNDQQLANIVWGEAGDSDDPIVPYKKGSEDHVNNDLNQHSVRQTGQSTHETKHKAHGQKLDNDSNFNTNKGMVGSGFSGDSWPESSLSNATGQNCMGGEVAKDANQTSKFGSLGAGTSELVKDPDVFEIREQSKEQGDFVDDGWANIGNFDDFDQVFSNDDQIFGNVRICNDGELWPSSKDLSDRPMKALPISLDDPDLGLGTLRDTSEEMGLKALPISLDDPDLGLGTLRDTSEEMGLGIKAEYMKDGEPCIIGCEDRDELAYHGSQNSNASIDHVEYVGDRSNPILKEIGPGMVGKAIIEKPHPTTQNVVIPNEFADETYRPRQLVEINKSEEISGRYSNGSSSENTPEQLNQMAPAVVESHNPSIFSQQTPLQGPKFLDYQHATNQFMPTSVYGNLAHPYPIMPMPSYIHFMDLKHQPLLYGNKAPPVNAILPNKPADTSLRLQTMTPQEKIEKLRRKQQMQAMLAIKKQQQQFNHQTSSTDNITQKCSRDNQTQHVEGADLEVEDLNNLPSLDPISTIDHVESNAISMAVDGYSWEEITLNQLQDTVAKLDMRIRLCIRDSLLRLGQSAVQRLYASTNNTSKSGGDEHRTSGKEDTSNTNRYAKIPDEETETNHIDRTVAHLLFHRNLEIPESSCPTKIPCPLAEPQHVDQFETNPYLEVSEDASVTGPADGEAKVIQASQ